MNATGKYTPEDIRVGDVWQSEPAGREAKVTNIEPRKQTIGGWCGFTLLATDARKTASLKAFAKGRKLVERGGVRVGETRVDGTVTYLVLALHGDSAEVEGPAGILPIATLASLPRHEEQAKVKAKSAAEVPQVPQKGDVWGSAGGRNRVEVTSVDASARWPKVEWLSRSVFSGPLRKGICGLRRFARGRVLLERDGKPVRRIVPPTLREHYCRAIKWLFHDLPRAALSLRRLPFLRGTGDATPVAGKARKARGRSGRRK